MLSRFMFIYSRNLIFPTWS